MNKVFTNGCFDILHVGHITTLTFARKIAGPDGRVIIGLNSDESVRRIKGSGRPINDVLARQIVLEAIKFVDEVIVFCEDTPLELIKWIHPTHIVKGGDYSALDVIGCEYAKICIAPYIKGVSSTNIIEKLNE